MPELYIDEETENREHMFCLLDVAGIHVSNRCSRCPNGATARAARLTLQRRQCPRDGSLANTFHGAYPNRKTGDDSKSVASSSKLLPSLPQETSSHETDGEPLVDKLAQMSLTDLLVTSTPDLSVTLAVPRVDVGEKRKAVVEPESQAKHQKKVVDLEYEFSGLAVQKRLKNKPQILFQDADSGNGIVCRRYPEACWTTSMVQGHPAARTSSAGPFGSFVAGCNVNTGAAGRGVFSSNDVIETGMLVWPDEMDYED